MRAITPFVRLKDINVLILVLNGYNTGQNDWVIHNYPTNIFNSL